MAKEVTAQDPATIEAVRFGLIVRKGVRVPPPLPPTLAAAVAQFWQARGQSITAMNRRYWSEEMEVFESVLVRNDDRASEWRAFTRESKKASVRWVIAIAVAVGSATIGREYIDQIFARVAGIFGR